MRNLSTKGLSMSQAQSISNLCNQRATEISNMISSINNAGKTITVNGNTYTETKGVPMPGNIVDLLLEKADLHACQAFLMEAVKSKDKAMDDERDRGFVYDIPAPEKKYAVDFDILEPIGEEWGWDQLTEAEMSEYLQAEAHAAHLGQFIHHRGKLDTLRKELPLIKELEWMVIKDGEKSPVEVKQHHTSDQLFSLHEEIASIHRRWEQRVNYFKAKVKNLVSEENARRNHYNAVKGEEFNKEQALLDSEYSDALNAWRGAKLVALQKHEKQREININAISALRIVVDPRFQTVVDKFLPKS